MKTICLGDYEIILLVEHSYTPHSADNVNKYDFEYFEDSKWACPTIIGIKIYEAGIFLKSAVIGGHGGGTGIQDTSLILEIDRLLICCCDSIFCLSTPDLQLLWKTKADFGTCFEIFKWHDDYVVHGELEITRLGHDGQIIWQQSGADIFVCLDSTRDKFLVTDEYVLATDWDGRRYKIDLDGNSTILTGE